MDLFTDMVNCLEESNHFLSELVNEPRMDKALNMINNDYVKTLIIANSEILKDARSYRFKKEREQWVKSEK